MGNYKSRVAPSFALLRMVAELPPSNRKIRGTAHVVDEAVCGCSVMLHTEPNAKRPSDLL
jgi:hypothetical protein